MFAEKYLRECYIHFWYLKQVNKQTSTNWGKNNSQSDFKNIFTNQATADISHNDEILNSFHVRSGINQKCLHVPHLFKDVLEVLAHAKWK
jgi:hypothetical protein